MYLDWMKDDEDRSVTAEKIIETIISDSPAERISREVEMLGVIYECSRRKNQSMSQYWSMYEDAVARYVPHSGHNEDQDGRQWAILSISTAALTADTTKSITFQLSTIAGFPAERMESASVTID